jgi:hypothetical protein
MASGNGPKALLLLARRVKNGTDPEMEDTRSSHDTHDIHDT